jgi:hypothetical protein
MARLKRRRAEAASGQLIANFCKNFFSGSAVAETIARSHVDLFVSNKMSRDRAELCQFS